MQGFRLQPRICVPRPSAPPGRVVATPDIGATTSSVGAFSVSEYNRLLGVLDSERFADTAPASVYATLLDEGHYHDSVRTMYRLLAAEGQVGERRRQRRHPVYTKPELAVRPNEVWSWNISKLKGPAKWTCFHLYVILDIFSRYVVGWMIAHRETAELAEQLIAE